MSESNSMTDTTEKFHVEFDGKVGRILDYLGPHINESQAASIRKLAALIRHGGTIDIGVRKDANEYYFEGDWLAWLFRP